MKQKLITALQVEKTQEEEQQSLELLCLKASEVWDEVQNVLASQSQFQHQVKQVLDLIEEGKKLLKPSKELLE